MTHALPRALRRRAWVAAATTLFASTPRAQTPPDDPPARSGGVVVITGSVPSSLPVVLPSTIESVTRAQIERTINSSDSEDALKYLPSLLVRKRYAGDYDHAVLSTRASGTGNSARSLVYADGILLSNLLGNGASFAPRWGLVTPEEIERVDVLYGPFSAAYAGNSVGAVVDFVTRMPQRFEAHAKVAGAAQHLRLYGTDQRLSAGQASASIGSRAGALAWWFNVSRLDSQSQPLVYATRLLTQGTTGTAGVPVSGAISERNRFNQDWVLLGTSSQADTVQDHAKLKLSYRLAPAVRASYTYGAWRNHVERRPATYLRDTSGNPVFAGNVNIDGRSYALVGGDFPQSRESLLHRMHGLSVKSTTRGPWDWEASASRYDYARDRVRAPTAAPPDADLGGAGRVTDLAGTGWNTLALKGVWRPQGLAGQHTVEFGGQQDSHRLRSRVSGLGDWLTGDAATLTSRFEGQTRLRSLWAQDAWRLSPAALLVLGGRWERWQAFDGLTQSQRPATTTSLDCDERAAAGYCTREHATRSQNHFSPKAALGYQWDDAWSLKLSSGRAVRMPTVSELYQGGFNTTSGAFQNGDPALRPERSWTSELSAEWSGLEGVARATLFHEDTRDALYAQTNTQVSPPITNVQNVDRIRTTGLELAAQWRDAFVRGLDLSASATYTDSTIVANANFPASIGKRQPRVPLVRAAVLATWRASAALSATLGLRHGGRQFNTLDNSDPNGARYQGVSEFWVADLRLHWRIAPHWSAALGIDNLDNQTYWNFHPYPQRTVSAELKFDLQ